MSYREDIDRLTELLAEVNVLTEKINNELAESAVQENEEPDALADYKSAFQEDNSSDVYYLDMNSEIKGVCNDGIFPFSGSGSFASEYYNPYHMYLSKEYAKKAAKMKKFNDILLAFKWCYDRDYEPDWSVDTYKYCLTYDYYSGLYITDCRVNWSFSMVYFSSKDIAQKCADWLNSIDSKGTLLLETKSNGEAVSV